MVSVISHAINNKGISLENHEQMWVEIPDIADEQEYGVILPEADAPEAERDQAGMPKMVTDRKNSKNLRWRYRQTQSGMLKDTSAG